MDVVITSGVHFSAKILQPPQARVHFRHFINGDCCITVPYILISFVRENRSKPALHIGVNLVLIKQSRAKRQCDKLECFSDSFVVSIPSLCGEGIK